jgi:hypothetical protein
VGDGTAIGGGCNKWPVDIVIPPDCGGGPNSITRPLVKLQGQSFRVRLDKESLDGVLRQLSALPYQESPVSLQGLLSTGDLLEPVELSNAVKSASGSLRVHQPDAKTRPGSVSHQRLQKRPCSASDNECARDRVDPKYCEVDSHDGGGGREDSVVLRTESDQLSTKTPHPQIRADESSRFTTNSPHSTPKPHVMARRPPHNDQDRLYAPAGVWGTRNVPWPPMSPGLRWIKCVPPLCAAGFIKDRN